MLLLGGILLAIFVLPAPWGIVAVVAGGVLDAAESLALLRLSRRRRAVTGAEALVGQSAVVVDGGRVRIHGESWRAEGAEEAATGDEVTVLGVDGLTLTVALRPTQER